MECRNGPTPLPEGRSALVKRGGAYVGANINHTTFLDSFRLRTELDCEERDEATSQGECFQVVCDAGGLYLPGISALSR